LSLLFSLYFPGTDFKYIVRTYRVTCGTGYAQFLIDFHDFIPFFICFSRSADCPFGTFLYASSAGFAAVKMKYYFLHNFLLCLQ